MTRRRVLIGLAAVAVAVGGAMVLLSWVIDAADRYEEAMSE